MKHVMYVLLFLYTGPVVQAQKNTGKRMPSTTAYSQMPYVPREIYPAEYYIGKNYRGTWQSRYTNGQLCDSGFLVNNMPDGLWKSWYPGGQLRMVMECSARKLSATKDEMQRIYRPGFSPRPQTKEMKEVIKDNAVPYDKFMYRQMYLSIHPPDMAANTSELEVTVQDGDSVNTFITSSPPFTECLVHGIYTTWFPDGALKDSGYCDDGIREGVWVEWNDEGTIKSVGFYRNGLRWKDWRYYNKEGKLLFISWFNRSEEITETIVLN